MRYGLVALMLFAVLPVVDVLAAPAPEPYAILEIEAPPEKGALEFTGKTPDQYRKERIDCIFDSPYDYYVIEVWNDPEVRKLPSIAALKDPPRNWLPRKWLCDNLRITPEGEGNRLRVMFRAGNRTEQETIINSLLRAYLQTGKERQKLLEMFLHDDEKLLLVYEKRLESQHDHDSIKHYQKCINDLSSYRIPERRAAIARYKQIAVIKWAR
jgi:hypothetical protein